MIASNELIIPMAVVYLNTYINTSWDAEESAPQADRRSTWFSYFLR